MCVCTTETDTRTRTRTRTRARTHTCGRAVVLAGHNGGERGEIVRRVAAPRHTLACSSAHSNPISCVWRNERGGGTHTHAGDSPLLVVKAATIGRVLFCFLSVLRHSAIWPCLLSLRAHQPSSCAAHAALGGGGWAVARPCSTRVDATAVARSAPTTNLTCATISLSLSFSLSLSLSASVWLSLSPSASGPLCALL